MRLIRRRAFRIQRRSRISDPRRLKGEPASSARIRTTSRRLIFLCPSVFAALVRQVNPSIPISLPDPGHGSSDETHALRSIAQLGTQGSRYLVITGAEVLWRVYVQNETYVEPNRDRHHEVGQRSRTLLMPG